MALPPSRGRFQSPLHLGAEAEPQGSELFAAPLHWSLADSGLTQVKPCPAATVHSPPCPCFISKEIAEVF